MTLKQIATRVNEHEYEVFRATTKNLGTTPSDALRMFIFAFNEHKGFPYTVQTSRSGAGTYNIRGNNATEDNTVASNETTADFEAFNNENDATRFATELSMELIDATR